MCNLGVQLIDMLKIVAYEKQLVCIVYVHTFSTKFSRLALLHSSLYFLLSQIIEGKELPSFRHRIHPLPMQPHKPVPPAGETKSPLVDTQNTASHFPPSTVDTHSVYLLPQTCP